ncbi:MAG: hypothetical protein HC778_05740, partial [Chamaesiphon sp. CSU_1_12]|nr:hypothetical protein [Chamaesiphon sp. CSU_1_12]
MNILNSHKISQIFSLCSRLIAIDGSTFDTWRTLKAIESILLTVTLVIFAIRPSLYNSIASLTTAGITTLILFWLSLNPPIDRPLGWRQTYIFCSLAIATIGDGVHSSFAFIAAFILLKACLLLPRRDVIWLAIAA